MNITIQDIALAMQARFEGTAKTIDIENVSIDSRSLHNNASTLFFALSGQNHNGHNYIPALINKGVSSFVVTHVPKGMAGRANFLVVANTRTALQHFALYYRKHFNFPVIAVTGSSGKTIVKEWLNFLLSPDYNVVRNPKSYNSQIGVPLSVIGINNKHNLGIFEAGISMPNEMEYLERIILPDIGVLTNIGSAHDEGFTNRKEKIQEKLKLFTRVKLLILQKSKAVEDLIPKGIKTFTWSYGKSGDVTIKKEVDANSTLLHITHKKTFKVRIPFTDAHATENGINCLMVLLHLGYSGRVIANRLAALYPVELRLEVKEGINDCTIIDDSYNTDFQSLKIALDFLEQQKTHTQKTIILSDIFQSGFSKKQLYKRVHRLLTAHNITRVIGIGKTITEQLADFPNFYPYKNTQAFLAQFNSNAFADETILIKGARSFRFEEIVVLLEEKTHETVLEINLNAVVHNFNFYRNKIRPQTKIMVMVKAFAYGSGSYEIAKILSHHKVDYLGVAFADEGIALRNAGITTPIVVMNPEGSSFSAMIAYNLEPEIYSVRELRAFIALAQVKNLSLYPIHIKIDTGMHRLGFEEEHLDELIALLHNNNFVAVKSIFSHLSASDSPDFNDFTQQQIQLFEEFSATISKALQINPLRHILNTSGIYNFPDAQYDMVRLGIGLYGVGNNTEEMKQLQNVGTLKTVILQIKNIAAGESVGYSRKFIATQSTRTATLPIGYADGVPRAWGNGKGYVMVNNQKARIIGSICMDMLMIDITNIACKEGDSVTVFGTNPSVVAMAKTLNTIPYEILASISQRVKRVFYKE
ncbi:bifunctional UDP-N-acetylmuramoyl-tripeptide:D-alanyl-D-alanine ligase/alanine racemase [Flavobacterium litorale]|uniref:Alanine racemase n=1 Tax=Flavobacterium litorale TaxID=2856519 RepID=A0ABX8VD41_9FLAO|nr:bifunctional UDP-N-acetylmuramoyl-tripeptide:D-alanyl-D-alanine ligase/alanine racemase [Flavobacterium litorale]QYJ68755.1 bifunctional UDP-N-acetylmuramoyl-tripeptide:D-alanyl-D-alanine ligase/alanine racemase [Flavobacterium litorale]